MFLHSWNEAVAAGPQAVGPKGWNLGRLSRYGFCVPVGGVLSADGYRLFMAHSELSSLVQTCSRQPEPAPPSLDRLRQAIITTPLPAPVTDELRHFLSTTGLEHVPVAVRSSAVDEDSSGASFAGIHQSFLNVTGFDAVSQAVRNCYASLWTVHALTYRHRLGIGEQQFATGVVILAMVPARTAGASFSCDPRTGRLDRYAISATLGLGETVVSGTVAPDEYLVDVTAYPPVIARQQIGHKAQIAVPALIAPEEIFHLTWLDMELYLMGRPGGGGLQLLAQDRQALRSRHLQHDPPDVLVGAVPAAPALPPKATGPVLRGLGAASGQAAGPARVIRHPGEGSRLRPGDVLVAPSTDPAWTPLFLRACAVVMEVGGYLSHGAIVAREYGLPAVINIPGLLQTIEDGEQLVVDGDSGQVHRLSKGAGS